jgi:Transposase DDE domain
LNKINTKQGPISCKSIHEPKWKKKLATDGFSVRDRVGPILGPLIAEFQDNSRERIYTPEVVVFSLVTGVLACDTTLSAAVIRNNAERILQGRNAASINTGPYSDARSRLAPQIVIQASKQMAKDMEAYAPPDPFWDGFIPYAIDGTTLTTDDSNANQIAFPQHGNQQEGSGFPLIRLVLLQSLLTGGVSDLAYGKFQGKETGEMALSRLILCSLGMNALLLGDRYFPSYFTMADLIHRGLHGLFQSHAARDVDFRRGKQLGVLDHIVEWDKPPRPSWMTKEQYATYPEKITLREVEITRECGSGERMVVVTNLMDAAKFTKSKLSKYYKKRWKIEVALKDLKDTFKMSHINAKTPEMVEKIIWAHILAYNILRWHILNAATLFGSHIENVSVKTAARILIANKIAILESQKSNRPALFAVLYEQMVGVLVGNRPGRSEPRAVKRRPKPFPRLHGKRSDWNNGVTA